MASKVARMLLVVVTALTLAGGALGVTGGIGSGWAATEARASIADASGGD